MSCDTGISFVCDTCISVLQRNFRTCPTFRRHWAIMRLWNLIKSGICIAKYFVFMLLIFQVDRQCLSIRFLVLEKKSHYIWTGVYIIFFSKTLFQFNQVNFYPFFDWYSLDLILVEITLIWHDRSYLIIIALSINHFLDVIWYRHLHSH